MRHLGHGGSTDNDNGDLMVLDSDDCPAQIDSGGGRGGDHDDPGRRARDSSDGSGHVQDSGCTSSCTHSASRTAGARRAPTAGAHNADDMDIQATGSADLVDGCDGGSALLVPVGDDGGSSGASAHDTRTWRDSTGGGGGGTDGHGGSGEHSMDVSALTRDIDDAGGGAGQGGDHDGTGQHAPGNGGGGGSGRHDSSAACGPYRSWKVRKRALQNQRRSTGKHA